MPVLFTYPLQISEKYTFGFLFLGGIGRDQWHKMGSGSNSSLRRLHHKCFFVNSVILFREGFLQNIWKIDSVERKRVQMVIKTENRIRLSL